MSAGTCRMASPEADADDKKVAVDAYNASLILQTNIVQHVHSTDFTYEFVLKRKRNHVPLVTNRSPMTF